MLHQYVKLLGEAFSKAKLTLQTGETYISCMVPQEASDELFIDFIAADGAVVRKSIKVNEDGIQAHIDDIDPLDLEQIVQVVDTVVSNLAVGSINEATDEVLELMSDPSNWFMEDDYLGKVFHLDDGSDLLILVTAVVIETDFAVRGVVYSPQEDAGLIPSYKQVSVNDLGIFLKEVDLPRDIGNWELFNMTMSDWIN